MHPKKSYITAQLFQSRLDQILNLKHPLLVLANEIDWPSFEDAFGSYYSMSKNYLKGTEGGKINAFLGGCGFNLKQRLKTFWLWKNCQDAHKFLSKSLRPNTAALNVWTSHEGELPFFQRGLNRESS